MKTKEELELENLKSQHNFWKGWRIIASGCLILLAIPVVLFAFGIGTYLSDSGSNEQLKKSNSVESTKANESKTPTVLTGTGQKATELFTLNKGLVVFKLKHDGDGYFGVKLLDSEGEYIDLLVNEVGTFDGSKAVSIEVSGRYLLDISANGNWTISF